MSSEISDNKLSTEIYGYLIGSIYFGYKPTRKQMKSLAIP